MYFKVVPILLDTLLGLEIASGGTLNGHKRGKSLCTQRQQQQEYLSAPYCVDDFSLIHSTHKILLFLVLLLLLLLLLQLSGTRRKGPRRQLKVPQR